MVLYFVLIGCKAIFADGVANDVYPAEHLWVDVLGVFSSEIGGIGICLDESFDVHWVGLEVFERRIAAGKP